MDREWHNALEETPPLDRLVNVFRVRHARYTHARKQYLRDEDGSMKAHWITQHGSCHDIDEGDYWQEFEYHVKQSDKIVYDGNDKR